MLAWVLSVVRLQPCRCLFKVAPPCPSRCHGYSQRALWSVTWSCSLSVVKPSPGVGLSSCSMSHLIVIHLVHSQREERKRGRQWKRRREGRREREIWREGTLEAMGENERKEGEWERGRKTEVSLREGERNGARSVVCRGWQAVTESKPPRRNKWVRTGLLAL